MAFADVPRPVRRLCERLGFRESLGLSYLARAPRLRWGLVVPTMLRGNPLERLDQGYNDRTLRQALQLDLVQLGTEVVLPYGYRKRGDSVELLPISLTERGRRELDALREERLPTPTED